ncbi:MAG: hypothetical protein SFY96_00885 [Planctomycetota bacterium]|nr:hypothetical protein [Planctomycetota bacterium]
MLQLLNRCHASLTASTTTQEPPTRTRRGRSLGAWLALLGMINLGQPIVLAAPPSSATGSSSEASSQVSTGLGGVVEESAVAAGGCGTTGVTADLTKLVPSFKDIKTEYTIDKGGGYLAVSLTSNAAKSGDFTALTQVRSTFSIDLRHESGKLAHVYGVKTISVVTTSKDGKSDSAAACNWHLVGEAKSADDAAVMAKSLSGFFANLSENGSDVAGFGKGADETIAALELIDAVSNGNLEVSQSVSGNLSQSSFCAGIFTPTGGWAAYRACIAACFAAEHAAHWATLMTCLNIAGTGATAAAGLCAAGCLGAIPCVLACLEAVGIGTAGFAAGCLAGYAAACAGAAAGCAIGCW